MADRALDSAVACGTKAGNEPLAIVDVLSYLFPSFSAGARPTWPPDAFAIAASLLRQSGAYTEIFNAAPLGAYESPGEWHDKTTMIAQQWRDRYSAARGWPPQVETWWNTILRSTSVEIREIPKDVALVQALFSIVATADQTAFGFGVLDGMRDAVDAQAIGLLATRNTLCEEIHPSRAIVLPKSHNPLTGMTVRSLSLNLALWDRAEVTPVWLYGDMQGLDYGMNVLLLPWPLSISPNAFRAAAGKGAQLLPEQSGFFTYEMPSVNIESRRLQMLVNEAERLVGSVDAVVFPELSLSQKDFARVRRQLGKTLIVAGVGTAADESSLGYNLAAIGLGPAIVGPFLQSKHHRWRLDQSQIEQYGLGNELTKYPYWWEAIRIPPRCCAFFSINNWLMFCVLICEDLARQDPVAELVRTVGPNLVIALLLDGPQIQERWSGRYAAALADDPGSSVLTLTSAGLVDLALSQSNRGPRSIGLWKDAVSGPARQILLDPGAEGVVLMLSRVSETEWTADGRHTLRTGTLRLTGIHQVRPGPVRGR